MNQSNSLLLNRFFTRNTFKEIIHEGDNEAYRAAIKKYVKDYTNKTNLECIIVVYEYLRKEYQNEYFYKNTLLNKLLLGIHNPNTTTALTEVPIANSKADFILINGKAVVYEIKTDLDNFERLEGQILDYYKAFSEVMVVTSEKNYSSIQNKLKDSPVGICLLTKRGTLSVRKKPQEYKKCITNYTLFKILRKNEYEKIIIKYYEQLPQVSQFEYYQTCQTLFEALPMEYAYQEFLKALKSRIKIDISEYSKIPYELKFLIYFSSYKKNDYINLQNFLKV